METITSRENAKIKYACAVRDSEKQRAADGLFFAEGPKLCLELAKSCTPRAMYATAAALAKTPELAQFDPAEIAPHVAEKLSGTKSNQGVFALFENARAARGHAGHGPPHFDAGGRAGPRQRGYAAAQRCRVRL